MVSNPSESLSIGIKSINAGSVTEPEGYSLFDETSRTPSIAATREHFHIAGERPPAADLNAIPRPSQNGESLDLVKIVAGDDCRQ